MMGYGPIVRTVPVREYCPVPSSPSINGSKHLILSTRISAVTIPNGSAIQAEIFCMHPERRPGISVLSREHALRKAAICWKSELSFSMPLTMSIFKHRGPGWEPTLSESFPTPMMPGKSRLPSNILSSPLFSQGFVARRYKRMWMQGLRPRTPEAYLMYVEESEGA